MNKSSILFSLVCLLLISSCKEFTAVDGTSAPESVAADSQAKDPLPSWNDGKIKSDIMDFVNKVTTAGSPDFVPEADRIATFDNDGTLWAEKPITFQLLYSFDVIKAGVSHHPEWKTTEPFKSVLNDDMAGLAKSGEKGFAQILAVTQTNMTVSDYKASVKEWIETARHPKFNRPYNEIIYQPMIELLAYFKANGFTNFVISGGDLDFMRPWATETYGIPSHRVIGSNFTSVYDYNDGKATIMRLPEIEFANRNAGKPVGINKHIGKRPIFAAGNSDGDLQMFQYTDANTHPTMNLLVYHTDAEREWAYDKDSPVGRLNKALDEAKQKDWTIVDMKKDWNTVFAFQ